MSKDKEYEIKSFDDLCNTVNSENVQRLAIDTAQWLINYQHTISQIRELHPKETKGLSNTEIAKGSFIWIDDGKTDVKGIRITTKESE
jgi:uncharacterized protein YaeQ